MIQKGLVSVTFRNLTPQEIILLCKENNLSGIEWGGDIHVPHGDVETAKAVKSQTEQAGLSVLAYGSYYRAGTYGEKFREEFEKVLDSAIALSAPIIRIWVYEKGSAEISSDTYERIITEVRSICDRAKEFGKKISFECHNNTLTDEYHSSAQFMKDIDRQNATMYWQPNQFRSEEYNIESLKALLPYITNVHVFHWIGTEKFTLSKGISI